MGGHHTPINNTRETAMAINQVVILHEIGDGRFDQFIGVPEVLVLKLPFGGLSPLMSK